jgi:integrase
MAARRTTRRYGNVRRLPSGRYQARYTGPDRATYNAPVTFDTKIDADTWLANVRTTILRDTWLPPTAPKPTPATFGAYAPGWLAARELKPRTRAHYRDLLDRYLIPAFGSEPLGAITPAEVRSWYARFDPAIPTMRAHAYGLLRTIMGTAVTDDLISANPCRIKGGGSARRVKKIRPATLGELETIVTELPERYRVMALLAAWCALRFGELAELRRKDVDTAAGVLRIRRAVISTKATGTIVGTPKSEAGIRDVAIPPHLLDAVKTHLRTHVHTGPDALLFPARYAGGDRHLSGSALYKVWKPAREAADRPDLRFHDLRHTGATLAAATGATLAELMARLGHSTPGAAMRYQHAAADRDKVIAGLLSEMATGSVTPIDRSRRTGAQEQS